VSPAADDLLLNELGAQLAALIEGAEAGHCVRVDDVDGELAQPLAHQVRARVSHASVNVLRANPSGDVEIPPERAIEIRNRKTQPSLLLVPSGEGHAASSLDNAYRRMPMLDMYDAAARTLELRIDDPDLREAMRPLRRHSAGQSREAWAEYMAEIVRDQSMAAYGRELWRLGLVPDIGEEPQGRIERNRIAARALSRPSRPAASIDERLTSAGLGEGPWRGPLRRFLEERGAQLANPRGWAQDIARARPDFSFHEWKLVKPEPGDLNLLEVRPFTKPDGSIDKVSKLTRGVDGQLILEVPDGGTAPIVIQWHTDPPQALAVARWKLEIVPPLDLRSAETEPILSTTVAGDKRRSTLKVSLDEDALTDGSRFVVVVSALGEFGEDLALRSGDEASAESQEFQIVTGEAPEAKIRTSAAPSVPEARVRAALEGLDDLSEDLVTWDLDGQVFGVRLGNRRAVQVRVNQILVNMQRDAVRSPSEARHYRAAADYGTALEPPEEFELLELPKALRKARGDFLRELGSDPNRDTAESAQWTAALREAALRYLASYKRALDSADDESVRDLLLLDSLSLTVRRSNRFVRSIVALPIHPLRLAWIAKHDQILRDWADQLVEVMPRSARASRLDRGLLAQVAPANLPFTMIDAETRVGVYAEELTFGAGLYLVPSDIDSDAAAESVCTVLGLDRTSSTLRASSSMLAERIAAYQAAHGPGGALRILSINPGAGDLIGGALDVPASVAEDEDAADPRRLELVCYTDSSSYVHPVPALADVQARIREREFARRMTHLAPPMSLSVRPTNRLLEETDASHLAVMQDMGLPTAAWGVASERKPTFDDLLVPLVTTSDSLNGNLVWTNVPALGSAAGGEQDLAVAHRSHQRAIAKCVPAPEGAVPAVMVVLDGDSQARINAAHDRADWVIGVDRFVGVDLFETGLPDSYILDYAPDFVEGIGDRLTVTTTHRHEVERLLQTAMADLGLAEVEESVGDVLSTLTVVSGRLALRLLENSTLAREAVSLAALVSHLGQRGDLDDLIIVPVDAHPEVFGAAVRGEGAARRCDLLLVRIGQRSFKIECVEVKSRKEARLPQALADHIVEQLEETRRVLESRFFADPPRIDADLQRARLTSLLHYYADRSASHGLISSDRIGDIHRFIDRVGDSGESAEISMRGYVISLDGDYGFKKRYGDVPLTVLTAEDLGKAGFTSRLQAKRGGLEATGTIVSDARGQFSLDSMEAPAADDRAPTRVDPDFSARHFAIADADAPVESSESRETPEALSSEPTGASAGGADDEEPAATNEIEVTLGQDRGGAAVTWRVGTKGSPHAFVIGIPGQGKSVTTRKIIRDFSRQGLPSLVFDFHGDMASEPPAGSVVLNAAEGLPFSPFEPDVALGRPINTTAWEIAEVVGYVAKLGEIQRNHVYRALQAVYADHGWEGTSPGSSIPSMEEFAEALEAVETGSAGKNARARLQPFTDFGLFKDDADGRFRILTEERHGWVIDVSQLGLEEVQRFAASFILRRVYREMFTWPQDQTMKLAVVLDEAHRMARDVTLPKIMKEGRKYGVGVIVASQSAEDFHKDVLANAGTKIVFRTNYPSSKAVGGFLRGRTGIDVTQEIEKLDVGVAFVSTPEVAQARKVYMHAE
jgi:hypothetical protein